MNRIIMVDFDGTISKIDTCVATLEKFAVRDWKDIEDRWIKGELNTRDCSIELYKKMEFDEREYRSFLEVIEIDEYFSRFMEFCKEKGYRIYVVSDGFDYNIYTILRKYGINDIKCYSNTFAFDKNGNYTLGFPYESKDCKKCGTCKSEIFYKLKLQGDEIVYIGDGYSDRCVASKVDILFAKSYLAQYCDEEGIPYIKYENFKDVVDYLKRY